jgi:hypothetical protein
MRTSRPPSAFGHARRVTVAALVALSLGLLTLVVGQGLSTIGIVRAIEEIALGAIIVAVLAGAVAFVAVHLADWRDPESEDEFEELVRHSEELAREGLVVDPDEAEFMQLDPLNDEDFEELVRDALDDLPDLLRNALTHVAVVISDGGRARGAYGLYQGATVTRSDATSATTPTCCASRSRRRCATSSPITLASTSWVCRAWIYRDAVHLLRIYLLNTGDPAVGSYAYAAPVRRWLLIVGVALAGVCAGGTALPSTAPASPGWSVPGDYPLPANALSPEIGYQVGGTATVAYLEIVSLSPLQTMLHIGVIPPGGGYQEQLSIPSSSNSIPVDVKFAEAPDGAAVLQWAVLQGSELTTSPLEYLASYRQAGSGAWEAPTTIAADATQTKGIATTLLPAISLDGTAAAGVEHLDATLPPPGGHRIDVAVHPVGGVWGSAVQVSPPKDSSEGLALGFDAHGNLTAAFRKELTTERHTLDALRRPASSGVWGSLEDVTGSDFTSDAEGPALGVAPDGSAVIAFQYVHYSGSKTLDVNAVTRSGATGPWTAPVDVAPGGASSGPMAVGVSPAEEANVLYRFQGHSSGEDCVGAVRAAAGGDFFSAPQCVSPTNFEPGAAGGVAFLGNDAYFAWSGQPNGEKVDVVQGSRWLSGAAQPDSFTNLDAPIESAGLDQLLPDEDGSVAAFWTTRVETAPGQYQTKLRAAAFDAGGPNLLGAAVPTSAVAGQPVAMSASFVDLWSGLGEAPSWSFGDGSTGGGAQVSHTFAAPGSYTVTVTARDGLGNQTSSTYPITVVPGIISPPAPVPLLTLLGSKVVGQGIVVRLGCARAICGGEARLTTREKLRGSKLLAVQAGHAKVRTSDRSVVVGSARFTLNPGQTSNISLGLNATGRKLLTRFRKLPVTLTVAGRTAIASKRLTILPPTPRGKHKKR